MFSPSGKSKLHGNVRKLEMENAALKSQLAKITAALADAGIMVEK